VGRLGLILWAGTRACMCVCVCVCVCIETDQRGQQVGPRAQQGHKVSEHRSCVLRGELVLQAWNYGV
jgi:hypothetical protein